MLLLRRCHSLTRFGPLNTQRYSAEAKCPFITGIIPFAYLVTFRYISFKFHRHQVAPGVASCAARLWSSSEDQRSHQRTHGPSWRHALAGLLAGTGAVLAYGLHHHKVRRR